MNASDDVTAPYTASRKADRQKFILVKVIDLTFPRRITRSACCCTLLVLLALILVMQGLNVAVTGVRGRAHMHREMVLVDFRRDLGHSTAAATGVFAWFGHHHGMALRHHHAADDPGVVFSATDRAADEAAENNAMSLDLTLAAFIAIVSIWVIGSVKGLSHRRAIGSGWQPTSGLRSRLERPPQPA